MSKKEERKSYYENYKNFWNVLGMVLTVSIMVLLMLGILGWGIYLFVRFDIVFYRTTQFSLSVLISSFLFWGLTLWYVGYYFAVLVPKWLKNLDMERGIKFNE